MTVKKHNNGDRTLMTHSATADRRRLARRSFVTSSISSDHSQEFYHRWPVTYYT